SGKRAAALVARGRGELLLLSNAQRSGWWRERYRRDRGRGNGERHLARPPATLRSHLCVAWRDRNHTTTGRVDRRDRRIRALPLHRRAGDHPAVAVERGGSELQRVTRLDRERTPRGRRDLNARHLVERDRLTHGGRATDR